MARCNKCGWDDNGTGDLHVCGDWPQPQPGISDSLALDVAQARIRALETELAASLAREQWHIQKADELHELLIKEPNVKGALDLAEHYLRMMRSAPISDAALAAAIEQAVAPFQSEIARLRIALRFYANGEHFMTDDADAFDTVSGEPQNWLFSGAEDSTTMIEDGSVAALALRGVDAIWEEDETPEPIDGEVSCAAVQHGARSKVCKQGGDASGMQCRNQNTGVAARS